MDEAEAVVMEGAWADFVDWAFSDPGIREQFKRDTDHDLDRLATRSPMDALVDEATGHESDVVEAFVFWVTRNHWGVEYAPAKLRERMEAPS